CASRSPSPARLRVRAAGSRCTPKTPTSGETRPARSRTHAPRTAKCSDRSTRTLRLAFSGRGRTASAPRRPPLRRARRGPPDGTRAAAGVGFRGGAPLPLAARVEQERAGHAPLAGILLERLDPEAGPDDRRHDSPAAPEA